MTPIFKENLILLIKNNGECTSSDHYINCTECMLFEKRCHRGGVNVTNENYELALSIYLEFFGKEDLVEALI